MKEYLFSAIIDGEPEFVTREEYLEMVKDFDHFQRMRLENQTEITKQKVQNIKKEINELQEKWDEIMDNCSHPPEHLKEKYDKSFSNNIYWVDYHCEICQKSWREYD